VENRGLIPKPKSDDERRIRMTIPIGAMTYIAAGMRAAIDIAAANGFDISHDLVALTSFYQAHDLPSWEQHIKSKKARGQTTFVAADPIAVWVRSHVAYLESVLGPPAP
jgi:collagenase-like PrtC family protease